MQLGATDFVSKADASVRELVKRVEVVMKNRGRQAVDQQSIREFVLDHHLEWEAERPGRILAIAMDGKTNAPRIVADGSSRLEALVNYRDRKSADSQSQLPDDPQLHLVPNRTV
jgi:hypothetical protein